MTPPYTVTISSNFGHNLKLDDPRMNGQTNPEITTPPSNFDYDMWLGPRPVKPFWWHRVDNSWRGYWDYNSGGLGDMGFHYLDPIQYFLDKDNESPVEVIPDTPAQHPDAVVRWRRVTLKYADGNTIILDGEGTATNFIEDANGQWLRTEYNSSIPDLQMKLADLPEEDRGNTDFMQCMRDRTKFCINEDTSHRTCTIMNMAGISLYLGRRLEFDSEKWEFIGDEQANRLVDQPMREPWSYDGLI
jgi:hypothetical protein